MFQAATISASDKPGFYRELAQQLEGLLHGERDAIANAANLSALLYEAMPALNWAGFYLMRGGELVLGPFQGKPACVRIPVGRGVRGTAPRGANRCWSRMCTPSPAISPAMPPPARSWSCR